MRIFGVLTIQMDIMSSCCLILILLLLFNCFLRRITRPQPPGPQAIPIIGHLYLINSAKEPIYRTFHTLSFKYGPIMSLRLGIRRVLLLSSASSIRECFSENDVTFSNRPKTLAGEVTGYNSTTIGWTRYGDHWRNLRRVIALNMFSPTSIRRSGIVRNSDVRETLRNLYKDSPDSNRKVRVNLNIVIAKLALRNAGRLVDGNPIENIGDFFKPGALLNLLDYMPFLRWIGYGGIEKKLTKLFKDRDEFLQNLIDNFRGQKDGFLNGGSKLGNKTIVEGLLALQASEPNVYTDNTLKGIIVIMFTAGMDTVVRSVEWAMALLLNHPDVLEKARKEIDNHVKPGELVDDSNIPKLSYLHCIMCETLRLFPVTPLLIPHYSSQDCVVSGYRIPKDTILLMNAWAVHRDPTVWEYPDEFRPERFESGEAEKDVYKFIPFGVGRRTCPGAALGLRFIGLILGALIQCFDWERVGSELEDLSEGFGEATLAKQKPLEAMYSPRPSMVTFLSQL